MASKQVETQPVMTPARQTVLAAMAELQSDPDEVQDNIMSAILSATNEEELFAAMDTSTIDARSRLDTPLRVKSVKLNESSMADSSLPAYCVLDVTNLMTGQDEMITCGAGSVLAGMIKLHELGMLPFDVELFERAQTARGFKPIAFRRATKVVGERF